MKFPIQVLEAYRQRYPVFLSCLLFALTYYSSWYVWRWGAWPSFIFIVGGCPWTLALFYWNDVVRSIVPAGFGFVLDIALIALAFAVNITFLVACADIWQERRRSRLLTTDR